MKFIRADENEDKMAEYNRRSKVKTAIVLSLIFATIIVALMTLYFDIHTMSFGKLLNVIFNKNDPSNTKAEVILVWDLYLPRIACGVLAGFALGVAGAAMQCVLRNPLGSPYTLGISNAAAFGASVGIVIGGGSVVGQSNASILISNPYLVTICSFFMAMVGTGIIIVLMKLTDIRPETMVLAGVAVSSIFSAGISALQYIFNDYALSTIVFWQFGSLGKAKWSEIAIVAVVTLAIVAFLYWKRWDFNALDNGTEVAQSLGVDVNGLRVITLVLSALMTAVVVSFMGIIAFIGLLGPHMIRMVLGNDHRFLIPGSMFFGAIILLLSDCIGQSLFTFTLPVGIITSFLGGPLFLYLLIRGYKNGRSSI